MKNKIKNNKWNKLYKDLEEIKKQNNELKQKLRDIHIILESL